MSSPYIHAQEDVERWGGKPEDYLPIHNLMDGTKAFHHTHRHRVFTHHTGFVVTVLEQLFGSSITNSAGVAVPVREIGFHHLLSDFNGRMPTAEDWLRSLQLDPWMSGEDDPPSAKSKPLGGEVPPPAPVPPRKRSKPDQPPVFDTFLDTPKVD